MTGMPNLSKISLWVFCLIMMMPSLLLHSCQDGEVVCHQFQEVTPEGWSPTDTLTFALPPLPADDDSCLEVDVFAETRVLRSYPYRNLTLLVQLTSDSICERSDTLRCQLFSQGDDKGRGQGVTRITSSHPLPSYRLRSGRTYTFRVTHLMNNPLLTGVAHVGMRVVAVSPD